MSFAGRGFKLKLTWWAAAALCGMAFLLPPGALADAPEVVVQTGHAAPVYSIAFSPDGRLMATGSWDTTIRLWDVATRKQLRVLSGHGLFVNAVAFSPDGRLLASGSYDASVKLWDVRTGREVRTLEGYTRPVLCVAFSPDGKSLASGGEDRVVRLWDISNPRREGVLRGHSRDVTAVAFSPDGAILASGGGGPASGEVKLWSMSTGEKLGDLVGHGARVSALKFTPDGKLLASASRDHTVKLWDVAARQEAATLSGHKSEVASIDFTPDGRALASGGLDRQILIWDVADRQVLRPISGHVEQVRAVAFSPDGQTLASGGWDETIRLWDYRNGEQLAVYAPHYAAANEVVFSPDGQTIATGSMDKVLRLWDARMWRSLRALTGHTGSISSVAFSPDGQTVASGGTDMTIRTWSVVSGAPGAVLTGQKTEVTSIAFHPGGRLLASAGGDSERGELKLWSWPEGKVLNSLPGHTDVVNAVAFSPDGRLLASGGKDAKVILWDVAGGKPLKVLEGHDNYVTSLTFSPDARTLASGSWDKKVILWDVATLKPRATLLGHTDSVTALAFSADGRLLASGAKDTSIRLWDAASGQPVGTLSGHTQDVSGLAFEPKGGRLLSSGWDGAVKLWSLPSGEPLVTMVATTGPEYIVIAPDHYYMTSRGGYLGVAFRYLDRANPFEQFDLRLNRPDLILQRLSPGDTQLVRAYRAAYLKRLEKAGLSEDKLGDDMRLPELVITTAGLPPSTVSGKLTFELKASEPNPTQTLHKLNVWVNDVPAAGTVNGSSLAGSRGLSLRDKQRRAFDGRVELKLSRGFNKIQVSVVNSLGVESLKQTLNVTFTPPAADPAAGKPDLYVVAVGVSKYKDSRHDLTYAAKDAGDLVSFFAAEPQRRLFRRIRTLPLLNQDARADEVVQRVRRLLAETDVDDMVVLFLAGHGLLDDKLDYYFGAHDVNFDNPASGGLPYEAVEGLLDGIAARRKLLLMDTCHAGEVDKETVAAAPQQPQAGLPPGVVAVRARPGKSYVGLGNSFALMQELFAELRRGSGATVIAAASGIQYAYEADGNGLFTHALLDGLRGTKANGRSKADADDDGAVRVSELRNWVFGQVQAMTGGRQSPTSRRENIEFDWALR